jgi:hypothetical protein
MINDALNLRCVRVSPPNEGLTFDPTIHGSPQSLQSQTAKSILWNGGDTSCLHSSSASAIAERSDEAAKQFSGTYDNGAGLATTCH